MEKRNVIEQVRTPDFNKQASIDETEKDGSQLFERDINVINRPNTKRSLRGPKRSS